MKICDCHNDFLTTIESFNKRKEYIKSIKSSLDTLVCAVFTTDNKLNINNIKIYSKEIKSYGVNFLLSIEDLGFIKDYTAFKSLLKIKPFSVTLSWNSVNQFAGGAQTTIGLSKLGKLAIKELEKNKILVDTAHMSTQSFWEFTKLTNKPIFNSHSNIKSIKAHPRNLSDEQIKKIVESNGFMGLTFYDKFISNKHVTSKDIAEQFDYLIKRFGYKNFGLGTDFFGVQNNCLPKDIKNYCDVYIIEKQLARLGYSDKIIKCLIRDNFKNFIKSLD